MIMTNVEIAIMIIILAIVIYKYFYKTPDNEETNIPKEAKKVEKKGIQATSEFNLNGKYKRKFLLTKTEYGFYSLLKAKCDEANLILCPKVRLEDFIDVTAHEKMKYRGYIKSRHVDFLICDAKLHIAAALELDDSSHADPKAQQVDNFKNKLFEAIAIKLYRIKTNEDYETKVTEMIREVKGIV